MRGKIDVETGKATDGLKVTQSDHNKICNVIKEKEFNGGWPTC